MTLLPYRVMTGALKIVGPLQTAQAVAISDHTIANLWYDEQPGPVPPCFRRGHPACLTKAGFSVASLS